MCPPLISGWAGHPNILTSQHPRFAREHPLPCLIVRLRPWMLVSALWIGPAILGAIDEIAQRRLNDAPHLSIGAILFASGDWLLYGLLTPGVFWLSARWPLTRPHV